MITNRKRKEEEEAYEEFCKRSGHAYQGSEPSGREAWMARSVLQKQFSNTDINVLVANYEEEGFDFKDTNAVKSLALFYVERMSDSHIRCLLYVLANSV